MSSRAWRVVLTFFAVALLCMPVQAGAIAVTSTSPVGNANNVARNNSIVIDFDSPLSIASITASTFRVWGTQSGPLAGTTSFSDGDQTLTFTPSATYFPGEWITIQMSHAITGADASTLRQAGYAFQFQTRTGAGAMTFTRIQTVSTESDGHHTEIYGGAIADLNRDGWLDYISVNEVSDDLRVFLNSADGTGFFGPMLMPPTAIGAIPSPSVVADFNNDGLMDIAISNTYSSSSGSTVSIALGNGDGTFSSVQSVNVPGAPHGIAALDIDGDGDLDLAVATQFGDVVTLLKNDGTGHFTHFADFDSGGEGEYALAAGDMNGDGIMDLVVGSYGEDGDGSSGRVIVLTGNGDGTFNVPAPVPPGQSGGNVSGGGNVWKLVLGDVNNDGKLDVAAVNGPSANGAILLGNGDGTLQPASIYGFGGHMVGSALGDLDGDGYLDWVASSFGASTWYVLHNNGDGSFTQVGEIPADPGGAASCASLYDRDNNGTLDMSLADEELDEILVMRNDGGSGTILADVGAALTAAPQQYTPGSALTYTITVTNNGPDGTTGTNVTDAFPSEYTGPTWTCAASGGATCAPSGSGVINQSVDLPAGGQAVFTVQGIVAAGATGTLTDSVTAAVAAPDVDPNPSNNTATVNTAPVGPPQADIAVTLAAQPNEYTSGGDLAYVITVTNAGPDPASATVADTFPSAYTGATWICIASGGASCAAIGSGNIDEDVALPSGGAVIFTVNGIVTGGTDGTLSDTVTASVDPPAVDPDPSNNTATLLTSPVGAPDTIFVNGFDGN